MLDILQRCQPGRGSARMSDHTKAFYAILKSLSASPLVHEFVADNMFGPSLTTTREYQRRDVKLRIGLKALKGNMVQVGVLHRSGHGRDSVCRPCRDALRKQSAQVVRPPLCACRQR
jgi:hypothetical protein